MKTQLHPCNSSGLGRVVVTALALALTAVAAAEDIKSAARSVVKSSSDAVVTVRLVILIRSPMGDQEDKTEVIGTVIDPSGLTVVPASAVDPSSMLQGLMSGMGPRAGGGSIESDVKETVLILADGTEIDAEMVLKDADLDLAFIKPIEAAEEPFTAIELTEGAEAPQLLDDVFVVSRLGSLENRSPAVTLGMIESIVKGPRTFYICSNELAKNSLGCVAFDVAGRPIGVFVTKQNPSQEQGGGGMRQLMAMMMGGGGRSDSTASVLRPVEDVLEIAELAMEAGSDDGDDEDSGADDEGGGNE